MNRTKTLPAAALATALLTGCTTAGDVRVGMGPNSTALPTRHTPNRMLGLATDLFYVYLPRGSTRTSQKCTPAPGGQQGGSCTTEFTSALPPQELYAAFAKAAAATGWSVDRRDQQGRAVAWTKTYTDGSPETVALYAHDPEKTAPPYSYSFDGTI